MILLISSAALASRSLLYAVALAAQIGLYVVAALGTGRGIQVLGRNRRSGVALLHVECGGGCWLLQVSVHTRATLEDLGFRGSCIGCG